MTSPPQQAPDTVVIDTLTADTLTFSERLRTDGLLHRIDDPASALQASYEQVLAWLLDPALWIGILGLLINITLIFILAYTAIRLVDKITARWTRGVEELPKNHPRRVRTQTISNLISSAGRYLIWPVALIMILSEINIDIAALIATAGIAGLAIGFGAQTLVRDVISGIFLLFDDSIHVGDNVIIGDEVGVVEYIGVRLIKVRKLDGELLMVPAGELRIFGNRSIDFARVVVPVELSYEQDFKTILPVIERVAHEWAEERPDILIDEQPTVQAITAFTDSSVTARVIMGVRPGEQFQAERDLRLKLKQTFDKLGIEIPFARRTVYVRQEEALPPRRVSDPHSADAQSTGEGSD